jgi:hypothetical protein
MPTYYEDTLEELSAIHAGIRVVSATAALTDTLADSDIFDIAGGRVILVNFYGENMAIPVNGAGDTVAIHAIPTTASAFTTSIIATATSVAGVTEGMKCHLNATAFGALVVTTSNFATAKAPMYLLHPGKLHAVSVADDVGTFRWFAFYVPVDKGAYMCAAT